MTKDALTAAVEAADRYKQQEAELEELRKQQNNEQFRNTEQLEVE